MLFLLFFGCELLFEILYWVWSIRLLCLVPSAYGYDGLHWSFLCDKWGQSKNFFWVEAKQYVVLFFIFPFFSMTLDIHTFLQFFLSFLRVVRVMTYGY